MGFPNDNLPSLDGQRDYTIIYNLTTHNQLYKAVAHKCHNNAHSSQGCKKTCKQHTGSCGQTYTGAFMEILRYAKDNILAKLQHSTYSVKCDNNGEYNILDIETYRYNLIYPRLDPDIRLVITAAHSPATTDGEAALINLMSRQRVLHESYAASSILGKLENYRMLFGEDIYTHIDRKHAQILINETYKDNVDYMTDEYLRYLLSNTYVNVVYDCNTMCVQSIMSMTNSLAQESEITHYGLLCTHRILGLSTHYKAATTTQPLIASMHTTQNSMHSIRDFDFTDVQQTVSAPLASVSQALNVTNALITNATTTQACIDRSSIAQAPTDVDSNTIGAKVYLLENVNIDVAHAVIIASVCLLIVPPCIALGTLMFRNRRSVTRRARHYYTQVRTRMTRIFQGAQRAGNSNHEELQRNTSIQVDTLVQNENMMPENHSLLRLSQPLSFSVQEEQKLCNINIQSEIEV